jgi:hypothetical protein
MKDKILCSSAGAESSRATASDKARHIVAILFQSSSVFSIHCQSLDEMPSPSSRPAAEGWMASMDRINPRGPHGRLGR